MIHGTFVAPTDRRAYVCGSLSGEEAHARPLQLDESWAYNIIKQVGNYSESCERNVGIESPLELARGLNGLWTKGGLMYAIPLR